MATKKIFVLNGHPAESSLNRALASAYAKGAEQAGHTVRVAHVHDMEFDPDYGFAGYGQHKPLEDDLETVIGNLEWADHVVVVTPMWWGGLPAKLKGLFDRTLMPGRAFDTRKTNLIGMPRPLLTGRSGRVIVTSDTPRFFLRLVYRSALLWQLRGQILKFIGINPVKVTYFSGASNPKEGRTANWLSKVGGLGRAGA